jgi:hypothetical protein
MARAGSDVVNLWGAFEGVGVARSSIVQAGRRAMPKTTCVPSGLFTLVYGCWKNAQKVQLGAIFRDAGLANGVGHVVPYVVLES